MARITEVAPADEAKIVASICEQIDKHAESATSEASWSRFTQFFYDELSYEFSAQRTRWLRSVNIVKWAEAGHPAADRAIRRFARDMAERSHFDDMQVSVRHYFLETAEQPFVPSPPAAISSNTSCATFGYRRWPRGWQRAPASS